VLPWENVVGAKGLALQQKQEFFSGLVKELKRCRNTDLDLPALRHFKLPQFHLLSLHLFVRVIIYLVSCLLVGPALSFYFHLIQSSLVPSNPNLQLNKKGNLTEGEGLVLLTSLY